MTVPITVLMAVHDGASYVERALASIHEQTRPDFQFLVVDDASTDRTPQILASAAEEDGRISVIRNAQNLGLTKSLNIGLRAATGEYVARIDADDIAAPPRLEIQADFLDSHPDHVLVGARERVVDGGGRERRIGRGALSARPFRYLSYFAPPIAHSTAMFRLATVRQHNLQYDEGCRTAQDFEFWQRILRFGKGCRLQNLLVDVREHDRSISHQRKAEQADTAIAMSVKALARDFGQLGSDRLAELAAFMVAGRLTDGVTLTGVIATALELEESFVEQSGAGPSERREIRALTVNRILKGASRLEGTRSTPMLSGLTRLFCRRPLVVAKEVISVGGRRTW
jgi:hypothetical protein